MSPAEATRLVGVAFDLDDTLLDHGRLTGIAYAALDHLNEAGLLLYGVTGRPSGWAAVLARLFPVRAIISENGALMSELRGGRIALVDPIDSATRLTRQRRLDDVVADFRERFSDIALADDVSARISDRTFDIGEHQTVAPARVAEAAAYLRDAGARVFVSSVHLHVTFDHADKASGSISKLAADAGLDATSVRHAFAYLGDSENDAACFAAFPVSIGVSNLSGRPTIQPRYLTTRPRGAGLAEAADVILSLRRKL